MNTAILSHSHSVLKAKKRAKLHQINEILFDDSARHEYLTGFRKRNILKKEAAQAKAKLRQKQERLAARSEQRRALQEQAQQNAHAVEKAYRELAGEVDDDGEDDEFTGFSTDDKEVYEDGEQLATVTVVEDFDPDDALRPPPLPDHTDSAAVSRQPADGNARGGLKTNPKGKKKFTYETKAARKLQSGKQKARRSEKAERAGGKHSKKAKSGKKR